MTQAVNRLYKHEDLSHPQHLNQKEGLAAHACNFRSGGDGGRRIPGAPGSGTLGELMSSRISEGCVSSNRARERERWLNGLRHLWPSLLI